MIPNANILLILTDSNKTKKSSTNDEGRFSFAGLAAGIYSLKIEVPGFNTVVVKNIVLGTNQSLNIDMTLQVSEVAVVGLFAEPNMIDTTSSSVTTTISGDMIRRLPFPQ
jgi:hypothetical protein